MNTTTIWRLPDVLRRTGLSRSTIYEMVRRGEFPKQVPLGRRAVGWIAQDVIDWIDAKRNIASPPDPSESFGAMPGRGE